MMTCTSMDSFLTDPDMSLLQYNAYILYRRIVNIPSGYSFSSFTVLSIQCFLFLRSPTILKSRNQLIESVVLTEFHGSRPHVDFSLENKTLHQNTRYKIYQVQKYNIFYFRLATFENLCALALRPTSCVYVPLSLCLLSPMRTLLEYVRQMLATAIPHFIMRDLRRPVARILDGVRICSITCMTVSVAVFAILHDFTHLPVTPPSLFHIKYVLPTSKGW